ncbi:hypothetical protein ACH4UM_18670 [Streptomyces sp. NPDC020801]|uniref:hypothetical protein n=1 Tax=Streptomyces sp. NPDC020801 TaxID=3365093 RepID=UPI0037911EFE
MPELTDAQLDQLIIALGLTERPRRPGRRPTAPCGTPAAYKRHIRNHEPIDDACRAANAKHSSEYYAAAPKADLPPIAHGTPQGARQHWYRKVPICGPCRDAYNARRNGGVK